MGRTPVPGDGPDLRLPSERALFEPYGAVAMALQPAAGQFDEAAFQALHLVLHTAAQHGVRLALVLGGTDSDIGRGTPATYMQWVSGSLNLTGTGRSAAGCSGLAEEAGAGPCSAGSSSGCLHELNRMPEIQQTMQAPPS